VHSITVEDYVTTHDSMGGVVHTPSNARTLSCRVESLNGREAFEFATRGLRVSHRIFFDSDPNIEVDNRITFMGDHMQVKGNDNDMGADGTSLLWVVYAERFTSRRDAP
jgi:head-tail adaptor